MTEKKHNHRTEKAMESDPPSNTKTFEKNPVTANASKTNKPTK